MFYLFDGQIINKKNIELDIYSPFLNYGQGLRRTMLYNDGQILWYDQHLKRLREEAQELGYDVDLQNISQEKILNLLEKNDLAEETALIKILCLKDVVGCNTLVLVHPFQLPELYLSAVLHNEPMLSRYFRFSNICQDQQVYWLEYYGRRFDIDQVLFVNHKGRITHAFGSNIIAIWNRNLYFVYPRSRFPLTIIQGQIIKNVLKLGIKKLLDKGNGLSEKLIQSADEIILINDTFIAQTITKIYRPSGSVIEVSQKVLKRPENNFAVRLRDFFLQNNKNTQK